MPVEVPDELAMVTWQALRDRWQAAAVVNGGGRPPADAAALLDQLRLAAYGHAASASGSVDRTTGQDGPGDTAQAAPAEKWVGSAEAAKRLHCTTRAIRYAAANGKIPGRKVGRDWLIRLGEEDTS